MTKQKNEIQINNLGECIMHIQASVIYLDKNYKKSFRFFLVLIALGLIIGAGYWGSIKTVNLKELTPLGIINNPFMLYAGENFLVDQKTGQIFFAGKEIGTIDKDFEIYKLSGKDLLIIHNKRTGRAFEMELDLTTK